MKPSGPPTPTKTVYTISQIIDMQKNEQLVLRPDFQRRPVWAAKAKSYLIDTILRGLTIPIILFRRKQNLQTLSSKFEVVDGQQRLRTILGFLSSDLLNDYNPKIDNFSISKAHNEEYASLGFNQLPKSVKEAFLEYELSVHILDPSTPDEVVLSIFSRLNSTGAKLNKQELRNAEYFGYFKTSILNISFQNLRLWRRWTLFDDREIARMNEVEFVSDLADLVISGLRGKTQPNIDRLYEEYDDAFPFQDIVEQRIQATLDAIDGEAGSEISHTIFSRQALLFSLFAATYDHMYGIGSRLINRKPRPLPSLYLQGMKQCSRKVEENRASKDVLDAIARGTADPGRRKRRHVFLMKEIGLDSASSFSP